MINLELFAERVRECRENMGMSMRDLAEKVGTSPANISRYETGKHGAGVDVLTEMAKLFNVNPAWLMGAQVDKYLDNIPCCKRIPVVGTIAAGMPIIAEDSIAGYEWIPENENISFCLKVKGNSMIGARIIDGDVVYIRQQNDVENGEIAVVMINGEEATLKRVYKINGSIILRAENPNFKEMVITKRDVKDVKILGKAVFFKSEVR